MARHLRSHLTYANVVSTVCLFIVLGGVAYAATRITGREVVDGSLTGRDVKNRSLKPVDFRKGSLPAGQRGLEGAPGPRGPAGTSGSPDTATQVRAKLRSVDGTGSGIDADLLDGREATTFVAEEDTAGGDLTGTFSDLQLGQGSVSRRELASGGPFGSISFEAFSVPAGGCVQKVSAWDQANLGEVAIAFPESLDLGAGVYMRPTVVSHPGEFVLEICNAGGGTANIPFGTFFQARLIG